MVEWFHEVESRQMLERRESHATIRGKMITRTLPFIRLNVQRDPGGPEVYGGMRALGMLVQMLRSKMPEHLAPFLLYFALPLAIRRKLDAQAFLTEGNRPEAARLIEQQARFLGQAQYPGVQGAWSSVATLIEQVATWRNAWLLCMLPGKVTGLVLRV